MGSPFGKITAAFTPVTVEAKSLAVEVPEGQVWKNYILVGGQRVAIRVYDATTSEVFFLLSDQLGSTSIVTDESGTLVSELRYSAYGEERYSSGDTPTNFRYTGQLSKMAEIGLYHYGARWYDPVISHFTQPDSIVPDAYNPIDWDHYAYVRNAPINNIDPTGHMIFNPSDGRIRYGGSGITAKFHGGAHGKNPFQILTEAYEEKTPYDQLSEDDKNLLEDAYGWNEPMHDELWEGNAEDIAGTIQDPVAILIAMISAGKLSSSAITLVEQLIISGNIVNLYRAVSARELADILKNRILRPDPNGMSMSGKFFTDSANLAKQWGQALSGWSGETYTVIEVGVPQFAVNQMQHFTRLDGIGSAWYAEGPALNLLNQFLRYINVIQ